MSKKAIGVAIVFLCLAGGVAGAWWWNASAKTAAAVASALPAQPDLSSAPAPLRERVTAAGHQARSTFGAAEGLAKLARLYHSNGFFAEAVQCYTALERLQPRYILPSHQDDFFRPLSAGFQFGPLTDFARVLRDSAQQNRGRLILLNYFRPWMLPKAANPKSQKPNLKTS